MNTEDSEFERIKREQAMRGVPDAIHYTNLADDAREALAQIMPSDLNIIVIHQPEPVIVQQPASVDEMHAIGNGIMYGNERDDDKALPTPTALEIVRDLTKEWVVEPATAIRWLAERANEFKTIHESNK